MQYINRSGSSVLGRSFNSILREFDASRKKYKSNKIEKLTASHQAAASIKVTSMQHECYIKRGCTGEVLLLYHGLHVGQFRIQVKMNVQSSREEN